eukprot:COSAG05_NODE_1028_length_6112_cov_11.983868_10_plen_32_part_01
MAVTIFLPVMSRLIMIHRGLIPPPPPPPPPPP